MKKVSLADVAQSLGLSKTLVSLVLNGKGTEYGISVSTQERVRKRAEELSYYPNYIAKTLRTKRSNIIGLIVTDISNEFYSHIARAVERQALAKGYHVIFASSEEDVAQEQDLIRLLKDKQQVDGIIIATTQHNARQFEDLQREQYPLVFIDRYLNNFDASCVTVDNKNGSAIMLKYLQKKGCERIALLAISPSHISTINDRVAGYTEYMQQYKLPIDKELIKEISHHNIQTGIERALDELMALKRRPDAIFALNNQLALSCLAYFKKKKTQAPLLVSFDDIDAFELAVTPVAAIAQPTATIGEKAVELLLAMINKQEVAVPKSILLPVTLVLR